MSKNALWKPVNAMLLMSALVVLAVVSSQAQTQISTQQLRFKSVKDKGASAASQFLLTALVAFDPLSNNSSGRVHYSSLSITNLGGGNITGVFIQNSSNGWRTDGALCEVALCCPGQVLRGGDSIGFVANIGWCNGNKPNVVTGFGLEEDDCCLDLIPQLLSGKMRIGINVDNIPGVGNASFINLTVGP